MAKKNVFEVTDVTPEMKQRYQERVVANVARKSAAMVANLVELIAIAGYSEYLFELFGFNGVHFVANPRAKEVTVYFNGVVAFVIVGHFEGNLEDNALVYQVSVRATVIKQSEAKYYAKALTTAMQIADVLTTRKIVL